MQVGPYVFNREGEIIAGQHPITVKEVNRYMSAHDFEKQHLSCKIINLFIKTIHEDCTKSRQCDEKTLTNFARLLDLQNKHKC